MDKNEALKAAKKYKDSIIGSVEFDEVFLYGSYANGNPGEHSDIDIAVVVEKCGEDYFDIVKRLWKLRWDIDVRIEPILLVKSQDVPGFYDEIVRTGILIN